MLLAVILMFVGVFTVVALVLYALGSGSARQKELVHATLNTALTSTHVKAEQPLIDFRKKESFSALPWLNGFLLRSEFMPTMQTMLSQADVQWTMGTVLLMSLACFMVPAYLVDWRTGSMFFGFLVGVACSSIPVIYIMMKRNKRFAKFEQGLPDALDLMVSALKVGHSLVAAMGLVARECADPVGPEFKKCFEEQNYGLEMRTALDNMTKRMPRQDMRIIATAILIQKESGGNLAEVLDKTAHVIRERFRLKRQVGTHTAQGRLTGWILSALPVVLGVGLYIVNPDTMSLLWHREIGIKLLYISGTMTVIGSLIIRQIVNMEV